jgi:hypothetical protein
VKKWLFLGVVALSLVVYASSTRYGLVLGPLRLSLAPDKLAVEVDCRRFLEDIQFKDFAHAATFHTEQDRKVKDIPKLIEEKFQIKPELLDIRSFEILRVDIMSNGKRAKVLTKVFVKVLNAEQKVREMEAAFFFKQEAGGKWFMDLQSSL